MLGVKGERELQVRHAQRYSSHHVLTHQRLRLPILAAPRFAVIVILDPRAIAGLQKSALALDVYAWLALRKNETVVLANGLLEQFHISRQAKYRCPKALEGAGLITVEERKDRNPILLLLLLKAGHGGDKFLF